MLVVLVYSNSSSAPKRASSTRDLDTPEDYAGLPKGVKP